MKRQRRWEPRPIDRTVLATLGTLHMFSGFYLFGPWYLDTWNERGKAPLANLFNSDTAVTVFGALLFIGGAALMYSAAANSASRFYTQIASTALLTGFLMRLYSLIGVAIAAESWRPPSYVSHVATVIITGAYWVMVQINGRTAE